MRALESLDGVSKVRESGPESFEVILKGDAKASPSMIRKALPKRYPLDGVEATASGKLSRGDAELRLETPAGQRFRLENRGSKGPSDRPEDLVARLKDDLAKGRVLARLEG